MKKADGIVFRIVFPILVSWAVASGVFAGEKSLRYSCSAQIYEAFESERLASFTKETGIAVDLFVASSPVCVNRLMNGVCDIASTTRGLHYSHKESGYVEISFCRDPLAVIVHKKTPVENLTKKQLREIFMRDITNWNRISGPDLAIVLTVPGEETGAYKNFHRQVMRMKDIEYDYTTYKSTQIIQLVRNIPGSISFIARGAVIGHPDIRSVAVDGLAPTNRDYPLSQEFSFVTRGDPTGAVKTFVDFALSDTGRAIMKKRGMTPIH